jgi:outer membrane protein TolC
MRSHMKSSSLLVSVVTISTLFLGGCATFTQDGGLDSVSEMTRARTGQTVQRASAVPPGKNEAAIAALVANPLTPNSAVALALLNNRGLQASFADLGIAEADLVQAGRLRNPGVAFGRMRGGDDIEIDRSIMFDLIGIFTLPARTKIEGRRFEQAKLSAASQAVQLATDTRKAYFFAVAAQQSAKYAEQVAIAAQASAELAQRMAKVGNWSKLEQAREEVFHADALTQLARTRHNVTVTREQLIRMLGLWGTETDFKLPDRLPDLPKAPNEMMNAEAQAMEQRLDVQMAKRDTEATASALGLTRATGLINVFDAGYINRSETGKPRSNGYEVSLELPIFDWGGARIARAQASYMQAVYHTADVAIRARSEVRETYSAYRTSYDVAKHYRDDVVPLRKRISDEVMLRYNGMLASVFELLTDSKEQIASVNTAIEAQKDFWIAETELQTAINGTGGPSSAMRTGP